MLRKILQKLSMGALCLTFATLSAPKVMGQGATVEVVGTSGTIGQVAPGAYGTSQSGGPGFTNVPELSDGTSGNYMDAGGGGFDPIIGTDFASQFNCFMANLSSLAGYPLPLVTQANNTPIIKGTTAVIGINNSSTPQQVVDAFTSQAARSMVASGSVTGFLIYMPESRSGVPYFLDSSLPGSMAWAIQNAPTAINDLRAALPPDQQVFFDQAIASISLHGSSNPNYQTLISTIFGPGFQAATSWSSGFAENFVAGHERGHIASSMADPLHVGFTAFSNPNDRMDAMFNAAGGIGNADGYGFLDATMRSGTSQSTGLSMLSQQLQGQSSTAGQNAAAADSVNPC